jgi:hypothetical protein
MPQDVPNFALLDMSHPEVAGLVVAMVQACEAVALRSWSHPQEPITDAWWADVLADPRTRKRERRADLEPRSRRPNEEVLEFSDGDRGLVSGSRAESRAHQS